MILTIRTAQDGELSFSDKYSKPVLDDNTLHRIEQFTSLKKAIAQSMKYLTSDGSSSKPSGNSSGGMTGGMFS